MDQFKGITFLTMSQFMLLLLGTGLRTNPSVVKSFCLSPVCTFAISHRSTKFVVSIVGGCRSSFGLHGIVDMLQGTD